MQDWFKLMSDMIHSWWSEVEAEARKILPVLRKEANLHGIDYRYLVFILMRHPRTLRSLSVDTEALQVIIGVWKSDPRFQVSFTGADQPSEEMEFAVNDALEHLARWAEKVWLPRVILQLKRVTKRNIPQARRLWLETPEASRVPSPFDRHIWEWMRAISMSYYFSGPSYEVDKIFRMVGVRKAG